MLWFKPCESKPSVAKRSCMVVGRLFDFTMAMKPRRGQESSASDGAKQQLSAKVRIIVKSIDEQMHGSSLQERIDGFV